MTSDTTFLSQKFGCFPVFAGNSPQPLDTGGLVGRVGLAGADVDLTGDGLVDDGLLLLLQQRNQLLLGVDVAPDAPVGVVEEVDDGGLFGKGRDGQEGGDICTRRLAD